MYCKIHIYILEILKTKLQISCKIRSTNIRTNFAASYSKAQLDECILEGEIDKMTLKKCVKTTAGLLCYLDVEIYTKNEKYLTYVPVIIMESKSYCL
jgi:hypothetical protein